MLSPKIIYIDCTATYNSGLNTGIQRVVNNVISRAPELSQNFGIEIIPVVAVSRGFKKLSDMAAISRPASPLELARNLSTFKQGISKFLWETSANSSPVVAFLARKAHATFRFISFLLRKFLKTLRSIRLLFNKKDDHYEVFTSDDLLLILDSFWIYDALDVAEKNINSKPVVVSVIYDLIPITHPQYCDQEFVKRFALLLPRIVELSDGLIGISQTVQKSVANYISEHFQDWTHRGVLDFFYLGADFKADPLSQQSEQLPDDIAALLSSNFPFFLAVGTVEPRKGYGYLLEGFEILWHQGNTHPLVIVGKVGWLCLDVLKRAQELKRSGRPLLLLHDVDDYSLDLLYKKSAAVIFPSFIEGFGLPLVEALVRGKQVLASNIEVFEEIGGTNVFYFKAGSAESLARSVGEFINPLSKSDHSAETRIIDGAISWDESAHILIQKSIDIFSKINSARSSGDIPVLGPAIGPPQEILFSKDKIESSG